MQSVGQHSALLRSLVQSVMQEKKVWSVQEPAKIWICLVSVLPASPAASVHLAL